MTSNITQAVTKVIIDTDVGKITYSNSVCPLIY